MKTRLLGSLTNLHYSPPGETDGGGAAPNGGGMPAPMSGEDNFYGSTPAAAPAASGKSTPAASPTPASGGPKPVQGAADDDFGSDDDTTTSGDLDAGDDNVDAEGVELPDDLAEFNDKPPADATAPATPVPAAPMLRLDPESLAALRTQQQQQTNQPANDGFTPEQIQKTFNPVIVSPEMLQEMGFSEVTEGQLQGFQKFTNAVVKNAVSITKFLMKQKEAEFQGQLAPLVQQQKAAVQQQTQQEFYAKYPSLTKYQKAVKMAANEVSAVGPDGRELSKEDLFKAVANQTVKNLRLLGVPLTKPQANHSADGASPGSVPRPNKVAPSGRSGGDQHSNKGKPNNADAEIYAGR